MRILLVACLLVACGGPSFRTENAPFEQDYDSRGCPLRMDKFPEAPPECGKSTFKCGYTCDDLCGEVWSCSWRTEFCDPGPLFPNWFEYVTNTNVCK